MKKRTGYIYKHGKTFWLRYAIGGKRVTQTLGTANRRDADTAAAKIMAPISAADEAEALRAVVGRLNYAEETAARLHDEAHPPLTFVKAWPAYVEAENRPHKAGPRTLIDYEGMLSAFTGWLKAHHPGADYLRDVTPEMAAAFIRHLEKEKKYSANRVNKFSAFLKTFFRVLAKPGRITANPFNEIGRREDIPQTKRPLTIEEIKTVIESAQGEMKTLFMLGTFTGLRMADAATLRWDETDLKRAIIRRIPRKTRRKREPVIIGIPAILGEHLAALPRRGPFILPDVAAAYEHEQSGVCKAIQAHLEKCGIQTIQPGTGFERVKDKNGKPKWHHTGKRAVVLAGFHSLRHSFVSMHAQAGTPQAVLQKLAGHGNPIMTEHYTHISEATARQSAAALPTIIGEAPAPRRDPLPAWAVELVKGMTKKTWQETRAELLAPPD